MTEDTDELSESMKEELSKVASGKYDCKDRTGKSMEEVVDQIDEDLEDQKTERARWTRKE